MAKMNPESPTGNVLLIEHIPNTAVLDAHRERGQAMQREVYAAVSKADEQKVVEGFEKYRSFLNDEYWNELTFTK